MANDMVYGMMHGASNKTHYTPAGQPLLAPSEQWRGTQFQGHEAQYEYAKTIVQSQSYYMAPRYG